MKTWSSSAGVSCSGNSTPIPELSRYFLILSRICRRQPSHRMGSTASSSFCLVITLAPEIFQHTMSSIFVNMEDVICHLGDVLIHGRTTTEHKEMDLTWLRDACATLNSKCEFSKTTITFLGHIITPEGVKGDPDKVAAIQSFPPPTNVTELQWLNGMAQRFGEICPWVGGFEWTTVTASPEGNRVEMGQPEAEAFQLIKDKLMLAETLALYDSSQKTTITADACPAQPWSCVTTKASAALPATRIIHTQI